MHGIGTFRTDSMKAVITGTCFLLLILRLAPLQVAGLGALMRCTTNHSQVCLNLYYSRTSAGPGVLRLLLLVVVLVLLVVLVVVVGHPGQLESRRSPRMQTPPSR